jgi:hypothetical protein
MLIPLSLHNLETTLRVDEQSVAVPLKWSASAIRLVTIQTNEMKRRDKQHINLHALVWGDGVAHST